ncbi:hypothetical protein PHISP_06280 [Aspergillus sp. HF37]|nr:hypothetical protein PHISP_06280 [Aspergillus sp. HF37]
MINVVPKLVARDGSDSGDDGLPPAIVDLLIALLVLLFVALLLTGGLLLLRRRRRSRKQPELPFHNGQVSSNHRRLTVSTSAPAKTESVFVYDEKRSLMENSDSPPDSPVPEIRITFPEEEDEAGKRKSGRMVVVRISEGGGVGLEPCNEELPPYQASESDRFHSLDIERMGGLKEKEEPKRWS